MKKLLSRIYWHCFVVRLSLKWVFSYNLGDKVWHGRGQWTLVQGVCAPRWILQKENQRIEVYESAFRKVRSFSNYLYSFRSGHRFYMQNWYSIWLCEGVMPWMKNCKIWKEKP